MDMTGLPENVNRVWICEECEHTFSDEEIRKDAESGIP
jgi:rubrerythrin